jgi:inner membrane protein
LPGEAASIDNLSHALIGSAVAALAPTGVQPAIVIGTLLGAECPDFDFVLRLFGGEVTYLKHHRGPTHGLVVLPVWAAAFAGLLHLIWPGTGFWPIFWWTLLGGLSHVVFDFGNDYGTKGLWPFSQRWIAFDIIPIVDVWMLGLIAVGWVVNWLSPGQRQAVFAVVWLGLTAYVVLRFWLRSRAWHLVVSQFDLEKPCGDAVPCGVHWRHERVTIHPTLLSLNAWRYVVQGEGEYLTGMVWLRQGRVSEPERARNEHDEIVLASLKSQVVTAFAGWVRRPRVSVERQEDLYLVRWTEMRYEAEGFAPFSAYAWLDKHLRLVDEGLGSKKPEQMDREAVRRRLRKEMGKEEP